MEKNNKPAVTKNVSTADMGKLLFVPTDEAGNPTEDPIPLKNVMNGNYNVSNLEMVSKEENENDKSGNIPDSARKLQASSIYGTPGSVNGKVTEIVKKENKSDRGFFNNIEERKRSVFANQGKKQDNHTFDTLRETLISASGDVLVERVNPFARLHPNEPEKPDKKDFLVDAGTVQTVPAFEEKVIIPYYNGKFTPMIGNTSRKPFLMGRMDFTFNEPNNKSDMVYSVTEKSSHEDILGFFDYMLRYMKIPYRLIHIEKDDEKHEA